MLIVYDGIVDTIQKGSTYKLTAEYADIDDMHDDLRCSATDTSSDESAGSNCAYMIVT